MTRKLVTRNLQQRTKNIQGARAPITKTPANEPVASTTAAEPKLISPADILRLQRTIGNRQVTALIMGASPDASPGDRQRHPATATDPLPAVQRGLAGQDTDGPAKMPLKPPHFAPKPPAALPPDTPAWTDRGQIFFGAHSLFASPVEQEKMVRHEVGHAIQQEEGQIDESPVARNRAEQEAGRFAAFPGEGILSGQAVPALLAHPPQTTKYFDKLWVGSSSIIVEVQVSGVAVRTERTYTELGMDKINRPKLNRALNMKLKSMSDEKYMLCKKPSLSQLKKLAKNMKKAGQLTAELNTKIPDSSGKHRVALVLVTNTEAAGYRTAGGKGLIVVPESDIKGGLTTVRHETSHAIFEHHSLGTKGVPDNLALQIADIFNELAKTQKVEGPDKKFKVDKPPKIKKNKSGQPAGLVMVSDTLWAGAGGHPWENVAEFFASAFAGYITNKRLFKKIVNHYIKMADGQIQAPSERLFKLLDKIGDQKALQGLKPPAAKAAAKSTLSNVKATPDWTYSEREKQRRESRVEVADRLIDPSLLVTNGSIKCP